MKCLSCNRSVSKGLAHYGLHPKCFKTTFQIQELADFESFVRKQAVSGDLSPKEARPFLSSYFAGNYRKYEATLQGIKYILKFGAPESPELSPVEYVCNKIADALGLPVPTPFALILFKEELAFVTRNFMEAFPHPHNLIHIYHYLDPGEQNYSVEKLYRVIQNTTNNPKDAHTFMKMILYDALIGNHDRHGRNLAIVETARRKFLAPIYDNPSALGLESGAMLSADWNPLGKILTLQDAHPSMSAYLCELQRLGFGFMIDEFLVSLKHQNLDEMIETSPALSANMKHALKRLIQKRIKELKS